MSAPAVTDAAAVLARYGDHASAYLAMNDETRHFQVPGMAGLIAYRPAGRRYVIQLCGPLAPAGERAALLDAFESWATGERRRVVAVQLMRPDADRYAARGYAVNQFGTSYSIDLSGYSLRGRRFVKTRNMVNRAHREGVTVAEVAADPQAAALDAIDAAWLRAKGRHVKELAFMIGERGGRGAPSRRLFVAAHEGRPVGYVSYAPVAGSEPGWLYDLTRRAPDAPPGVIEAVFAAAAESFQAEGAAWLHLGFTPFAGMDPATELPGANRMLTKLGGFLSAHGGKLYPAATQASFKLKWLPHVTRPEYIAFAGKARPSAVYALLRLTRTL